MHEWHSIKLLNKDSSPKEVYSQMKRPPDMVSFAEENACSSHGL